VPGSTLLPRPPHEKSPGLGLPSRGWSRFCGGFPGSLLLGLVVPCVCLLFGVWSGAGSRVGGAAVAVWTDLACSPHLSFAFLYLRGFASLRFPIVTHTHTLRMKRLRAVREMKDRYSPCEAVAPQLWGPGAADHPADGAVQAIASRQAAVYADKLQSRSRVFMHVSDDQFLAMYRQPWMEASPSRPSPAERAKQRLERAARPGQPAPPDDRDDNADALKKWAQGRPAWRKAWLDAQRKRKPRTHRVFEWQLLHNALPVGGAKAAFIPSGAANMGDVVCCSNPACRPVPPHGSPHTLGWPPERLSTPPPPLCLAAGEHRRVVTAPADEHRLVARLEDLPTSLGLELADAAGHDGGAFRPFPSGGRLYSRRAPPCAGGLAGGIGAVHRYGGHAQQLVPGPRT